MDRGWQKVDMEGDCRMIINALNGLGSRSFHIQTIIDNCRSLFPSFITVSCHFCFRECNQAAHRIAKWASGGLCQEVWVNSAPGGLVDILYSDLSLSTA